ncbi:MAG: hypothetical protein ACO3CS_14455, partial [Alphaproteobacteria bacterium]
MNAHHGNRFQLRPSFSAFASDARARPRAIRHARERAGEDALRVARGALGEGAGGRGDKAIEAAIAARRIGLDGRENRGGRGAAGGIGGLAQGRGGGIPPRRLGLGQSHGVARTGDGATGVAARG